MTDTVASGPARGEPMIRFDKATKTYKSTTRPALDNVSVDIYRGDFVFLIGPSGSGKSTFLRSLLKEEDLTSGDVYLGGMHINALTDRKVPLLRQRIGYVFQDFRLLSKKSVYDNVAFALEVIGKSRTEIKQRVPETLRLVGLETKQDRMPGELSGGEQQRVAIARAVINRPLVLLADEPTGNLDPATGEEIMTLLERINRGGTTVVMSTHNAFAVDAMRRRVLEMSNGRLVRDDARGVYGLGR